VDSRSSDSQHTYLAIAESLRTAIQTGEFAPGDRLPTARELMSQHGVATHTVTSALKVLQDEGLTYSVHGRGTFVSDDLDVAGIGVEEPPRSGKDLEKALQGVVKVVERMENELTEIRQELREVNNHIGRDK